jgi:hypothetical protein
MKKFNASSKYLKLSIPELREYGTMKVNQRNFKQDRFAVWTAVQECEGMNCVAAHACIYRVVDPDYDRPKCTVMMKYLKQVEAMILYNFGKDLSEADLFRVGMHLIPLYKQLVRFKISEMAITSQGVAEFAKNGTTKINGVFKEIREVIRSIDAVWKELGMTANRIIPNAPDIPMSANPTYYEQMERDALKEQRKLKIVRRDATR